MTIGKPNKYKEKSDKQKQRWARNLSIRLKDWWARDGLHPQLADLGHPQLADWREVTGLVHLR